MRHTPLLTLWIAFWIVIWSGAAAAAPREVVVGNYENAPLVSRDAQGGAVGIFPEILASIAGKEGWQLTHRVGSFEECLRWLDSGQIDLLPAVASVPERTLRYRFTREAIINNWAQVYRSEGVRIEDFIDLSGKRLAVVRGDIYYDVFQQVDDLLSIQPVYVEYGDYGGVVDALVGGLADAGVVPHVYGRYHAAGQPIVRTAINFSPVQVHFAAPLKNSEDLIAVLDRHLAEMKAAKHSVYYRSIDYWQEGVRKLVFPKWLRPIWVIAGVAGLLAILAIGTLILRWQVRVRTDALRETLAAKERIESELRIAHDIQMELLPGEFSAFSDQKAFDLYADVTPAREVGGDFYDFFHIDADRLYFLVADVSGKGVPAALFMARAKAWIKASAQGADSPETILSRANDMLCNESFMFVTCFLGLLHLPSGDLAYTCAGHPPPLLQSSSGPVDWLAGTDDAALGIDRQWEFHAETVHLEAGDRIIMFTDGVTEAIDEHREMFGEARLRETVESRPQESARDLVIGLEGAVNAFAGETPQRDDITIMVLTYSGTAGDDS